MVLTVLVLTVGLTVLTVLTDIYRWIAVPNSFTVLCSSFTSFEVSAALETFKDRSSLVWVSSLVKRDLKWNLPVGGTESTWREQAAAKPSAFSATAMASAFEMLVPSFASLASNSFEAFVAASFVPTPSSFEVTSSFPPSFAASAVPPFLSATVSAAEGDFGFTAAGADMFGLL